MQHAVLRCRPGTPVAFVKRTGVPHLQCTAYALHCVRDTAEFQFPPFSISTNISFAIRTESSIAGAPA